MSKYPRKPAKLEADCAWVSVAKVEHGNGHKDDELAWCVEYVAATRFTFGQLAKEAAECWYRDTDQSSDCTVTLNIEDATGQVVVVRVRCELVTRYTPGRVPAMETRVGNSIKPERREVPA